MNLSGTIIVVIALILSSSCSGLRYSSSEYEDKTLTSEFLATEFVLHESKDKIPDQLTRFLRREIKQFEIAEPNEDFNPHDFNVGDLPSRRLILVGQGPYKRTGFLLYEQGGITVSNILVVHTTNGSEISKVQFYSIESISKSVSEVKTVLENGNYLVLESYSKNG